MSDKYTVVALGPRDQFERSSQLIPFKLNVGDSLWRIAGGPDYGYLLSLGLKASDHIICELDGQLFDCGEMERYTYTKVKMASMRGRYSNSFGSLHSWWRLPKN